MALWILCSRGPRVEAGGGQHLGVVHGLPPCPAGRGPVRRTRPQHPQRRACQRFCNWADTGSWQHRLPTPPDPGAGPVAGLAATGKLQRFTQLFLAALLLPTPDRTKRKIPGPARIVVGAMWWASRGVLARLPFAPILRAKSCPGSALAYWPRTTFPRWTHWWAVATPRAMLCALLRLLMRLARPSSVLLDQGGASIRFHVPLRRTAW